MTIPIRQHRVPVFLLFTAIAVYFSQTFAASANIENYTVYKKLAYRTSDSKQLVLLRSFTTDSAPRYLFVNPATLTTGIVPQAEVNIQSDSLNFNNLSHAEFPYFKAMDSVRAHNTAISNAGITHTANAPVGYILTVDLCPAPLPLDRVFFNKVADAFSAESIPVPVAIAISGRWLRSHTNDFNWLISLVNKGRLDITWMNHSFNHRVGEGGMNHRSFLLAKGTDINAEILQTEVALLKKNIVPSVFFRFPGLVSDSVLVETILSYGLIPIGSNAWLAKNQKPTDGSIILVHANGNDSLGTAKCIRLLRQKKESISTAQWRLLDLPKSLSEE